MKKTGEENNANSLGIFSPRERIATPNFKKSNKMIASCGESDEVLDLDGVRGRKPSMSDEEKDFYSKIFEFIFKENCFDWDFGLLIKDFVAGETNVDVRHLG